MSACSAGVAFADRASASAVAAWVFETVCDRSIWSKASQGLL
jgi:hypothetical protein